MDSDGAYNPSAANSGAALGNSRSSIKQINSKVSIRKNKNSSSLAPGPSDPYLSERLEVIKKLCEKADKQGKKTVPTKLIQEILDKGNVKLPDKLPKDMVEVEVREVIKHVGGKDKSAACVLM